MLIVENPIFALIITLSVLIFFKLLFRILNYLEKNKSKAKPKSKEEKPVEKSKEPEKSDEKSNGAKSDGEKQKNSSPEENLTSNGYNYLYDRFVENPSSEDKVWSKEFASDAFLNEKVVNEIINRKVRIQVSPVKKIEEENKKQQEIFEKENKEKILKEFDSLSKEMKMLLIENILNKMD